MSALDPDTLPPRWQSAWRWGAPILMLATLVWIAWNCLFNPNISFLAPGPGKWIVYPLPPKLKPYPGLELTGVFRRAFALHGKSTAALLSMRCLTDGKLFVNNTEVPRPGPASVNWKTTLQFDIGPFLRQGSNEITVMVTSQRGPPALSLELKAENVLLASDETWEVSVSGSNWRAAQAAAATPRPGKGDELYLLKPTSDSLRRCWPWLCLFAGISVCGVALLQYFPATTFPKFILSMLAAAWVLLLLHNFQFMPAATGFDADDHLAYVSYIQEHQRLPEAQEGLEMYQAPLYYVIGAKLLNLCHREAFQPSGMMLLRYLSLAIGAANLALVLAGLRLIFPGDWKKPLAGLVLAAFLPAHFYLLHYTTNETLCAMFVTAALCVGLLLLRARQSWWGWYGVLGIVLGLGLLSKASAVLAVPLVLGALAGKLMLRRERAPRVWLGVIGAPLLLCLSISGWHYLKLWREFGNPFIGGWDPKLAMPHWQTKGFQTPGYYFSFRESLTRPFFSGMHSFWDGLYSTLWGDGLWGGKITLCSRPPWNYDFVAVGFVLALVPTTLVLTGLVRALDKCYRAASLPWLLLLGFGGLTAFALLDMSLKVPYYAQVKAFFGLGALLPFCALGALGFELWAGRGKVTRYFFGAILGLWLVNLYASFWIRPSAVPTELSSAIAAAMYVKGDSSESFLHILNHDPGNSEATTWLASLEAKEHPELAVQRLEQALKDGYNDAEIESDLGRYLAACNRLDEGVVHAKRAAELAPGDETTFQTWCALALRRNDFEDAIAAGRDALGLNPGDLQTHLNIGLALMRLQQTPEAIRHFSALTQFQPTWAEAQFYLGLCLLDQPGRWDEGIGHLQEAVRLDPSNGAAQAVLQKALKSR